MIPRIQKVPRSPLINAPIKRTFVSLEPLIRNAIASFRVFANETSQFLAPYEASVKPRTENASPPEVPLDAKPGIGTSASHVRIVSNWVHHFFSFVFFYIILNVLFIIIYLIFLFLLRVFFLMPYDIILLHYYLISRNLLIFTALHQIIE